MRGRPPRSTLFPCTTLFRSGRGADGGWPDGQPRAYPHSITVISVERAPDRTGARPRLLQRYRRTPPGRTRWLTGLLGSVIILWNNTRPILHARNSGRKIPRTRLSQSICLAGYGTLPVFLQ